MLNGQKNNHPLAFKGIDKMGQLTFMCALRYLTT